MLTSPISFQEVEGAIRERDREKAAILMAALQERQGGAELAHKLLLLGRGYLNHSLGHSVSCSTFILLEMIDRQDQDPWPALATLADYFCKGQFHTTPALRKGAIANEVLHQHLLRATSGGEIVNLHQTITYYAIERARHFFSDDEYDHMAGAWIEFLQDKKAQVTPLDSSGRKQSVDLARNQLPRRCIRT